MSTQTSWPGRALAVGDAVRLGGGDGVAARGIGPPAGVRWPGTADLQTRLQPVPASFVFPESPPVRAWDKPAEPEMRREPLWSPPAPGPEALSPVTRVDLQLPECPFSQLCRPASADRPAVPCRQVRPGVRCRELTPPRATASSAHPLGPRCAPCRTAMPRGTLRRGQAGVAVGPRQGAPSHICPTLPVPGRPQPASGHRVQAAGGTMGGDVRGWLSGLRMWVL